MFLNIKGHQKSTTECSEQRIPPADSEGTEEQCRPVQGRPQVHCGLLEGRRWGSAPWIPVPSGSLFAETCVPRGRRAAARAGLCAHAAAGTCRQGPHGSSPPMPTSCRLGGPSTPRAAGRPAGMKSQPWEKLLLWAGTCRARVCPWAGGMIPAILLFRVRSSAFLGEERGKTSGKISLRVAGMGDFIKLHLDEDFLREERQVGGWGSERLVCLVHLFIIPLILSAHFLYSV